MMGKLWAKKSLFKNDGVMDNVEKFMLDATDWVLIREIWEACLTKGIDYDTLEDAVVNAVGERDKGKIDFMIIKTVLEGYYGHSSEGSPYFTQLIEKPAKVPKGLLISGTKNYL